MKLFQTAIGLTLFLTGCSFAPGSQNPELAPIAAGMAVYETVTTKTLTVEFGSSNCSRITPFEKYRFVLTRTGDLSRKNPIVDRFVSGRMMTIDDKTLVNGQYEAKVYHEDRPNQAVRKIFSFTDHSPVLLMNLPCVD